MKISKSTMSVLQNFSNINAKLLVPASNRIKTISPEENAMGLVVVEETFPVEFGILDLNKFLTSVSLFKDPEFNFNASSVTYGEGKTNLTQNYANKNILFEEKKNPYNKSDIKMPTTPINFELSREQLSDMFKASSVLQIQDVSFVSNGDEIDLVVCDKKNPSSDRYVINSVGPSDGNTFKINFQVGHLKLMPGGYDIAISEKHISHFTYKEDIDLQYWIGTDSDSEFKSA